VPGRFWPPSRSAPAKAGAQGCDRSACDTGFLLSQEHGRSAGEYPETKMGAGIAADPLSPDFDPLIRLPRKTNRAVWFRRPTPPRAASGAKASCFGHRGRARYSCEPQHHGLDGQLGVPDRNPFRFASATTCRTAFRPVMSARASGHHGQHPSSIAGTWRDVRVYPFLLPRHRRLRVRISRPSATWQPCLRSAPSLAALVSSST